MNNIVCCLHLTRASGPWALTRQILREEGVRGMFRGLVPTFAREMPGYFFFFGGYEICRSLLTPKGKTKADLGTLYLLSTSMGMFCCKYFYQFY